MENIKVITVDFWNTLFDSHDGNIRNDANTVIGSLSVAKYENYSDYVTQGDRLKALLEDQGITVTGISEQFNASKTWLVASGTMNENYVELALTDYRNGVAVALIMSKNTDMVDMYSVLSTMLDTAVEDETSFAPEGESQGINPDFSRFTF